MAGMGGAAALALGVLGLSGCALASPFAGTGYDEDRGVINPGAGDRVVVVITQAQLGRADRGEFDDHTRRVIRDLPNHEGYIGHSVRTRVLGDEVWTMTVWRDEAAMERFVTSPVHSAAIRAGLPAVRRAKFVRESWPAWAVPPTWGQALRRLDAEAFVEYGPPGGTDGDAPGR